MNIKIDPNLGDVRVDVTTDIDHLAKYRLFIWKKQGTKWVLKPSSVIPEASHTADPADHGITIPPAALKDSLLQVVAKVNSLIKTPGSLDLQLKVYQAPGGINAPAPAPVDAYPIGNNKPVPFGQDLQVVGSYPFEFV